MEGLPSWESGTPGVLCVDGPHPIPVTTILRTADDRVLFALGRERETLRRLRADPRVALCILGKGVAFTAHGVAYELGDELQAADTVVAVELRVDRVQDHLADERTEMLDGARWRWTDERHGETEEAILTELRRLGQRGGGSTAEAR
jgi:hypothetical protein